MTIDSGLGIGFDCLTERLLLYMTLLSTFLLLLLSLTLHSFYFFIVYSAQHTYPGNTRLSINYSAKDILNDLQRN